ncbi:MAG: TIGR03013 family PEP-CTERM/XrtA system glycosyltransferase [Deltaproteobacteria bacterium]|nr:TIGR03013 family PEP-CTERM/XrtA system glycosyltransferase [Deltaproteobacteria bacterium]
MILRIFNRDVPVRNLLFVIGEGILIYMAVLVAAFLRLGSVHASFLSGEVISKAILIMVVCQISLYYNELYNLKVTDTYVELGLRLTKAMGVASIVLAIIYYFVPSLMMGRGIFFISLVFLVLLVVPWRYAYNWILKKKMFAEKVMILGLGDLSRQIIDEIKDRPDSGYQVAGVVPTTDVSSVSFSPRDVPVFSNNGTVYGLADSLHITKIIVALDEKRGILPTKELLRCKMEGIKVLQGETLYEELTGKLFIEKLNPSWLIFSDGFKKSRVTRFAKRAADFIIAGVSLLVTLPLVSLIALAIKLDSKGPVFFRQDRCSEGGRIFKVLKFRSMIDKAEADSGPCWATDDDARVTRVGKILRKYRMDEIPQMWNVLKGEMSFVGPRPERPEFVKKLAERIPYYSERHTVKPGITGWAQVSYRYGASVEDAMEKLKYDLFYVKNMSFAMDLLILFKTAKIMLLQSGAR